MSQGSETGFKSHFLITEMQIFSTKKQLILYESIRGIHTFSVTRMKPFGKFQ